MMTPLDPSIGCVALMVDRHVRAGRGGKTALVEYAGTERRTITYDELQRATARIAQELALDLGGARHQRRIAIVGAGTLEAVCWWLGAMRAGHLPFLVHPDLPAGHYEALWQDFDPVRIYCDRTVALAGGDRLPPITELLANAPPVPVEWNDSSAQIGLLDARPAVCLTSSGSTSRAKICVHAHRAFFAFERSVTRRTWGLQESDVVLGSSGPYFSFGLQGVHPALSVGATAVMLPEWKRHAEFLETLERERVTVFLAVPTLYHLLMTRAERPYRLDALRLCLSAGERLPDVIRARWEEKTGSRMLDSIGTTETFAPYLSEEADKGPGLREIGGFTYRYDPVEPAAANGAAAYTVALSGGPMMLGYYRADSAYGYERLAGPFDTDDLFERDGECWRFLSRRSERVKVAGYWVSPQELEAFLLADERVAKAVAVPTETEEGLTRLRAFIVPVDPSAQSDVLVQELMDRMREGLRPKALRPDRIEVVMDLSSTPTGKIRRQEARALARGAGQKAVAPEHQSR